MAVAPVCEPTDQVKTTKTTTTTPYVDPPLLTINNPVNYLRRWWTRVISREGIDFRLRIHPVTAFAIIVMVGSASFGVGRISLPPVVTQLIPEWATKPTPTPDPWKETAFSGTLQRNANGNFYLLTNTSSEAITLQVPATLDLTPEIGKHVLVSGKYNFQTGVISILDAKQIQIILQTAPILHRTPAPSPSVLPSELPSPSPAL